MSSVARKEESGTRFVEASLRTSERRFSSAFESAPIGMAIVAPDGRWLQVNPAFCALTGYEAAELLTMTIQDITHLDDFTKDLACLDRMLTGDLDFCQFEKRYIHRDRRVVIVILSVSLVRDDAGRPLHFIAQVQDVTERRQLEEQLRQARRLETIGLLASGVTHDFNNVLSVVLGHVESALEREELPADVRNDLQEVRDVSERAGQLTRRLLTIGRTSTAPTKPHDVCEAVNDTARLLRALVGSDVELHLPQRPIAGSVELDHGQLFQILMNLVINARDAMPFGGPIFIDVTTKDVDAVTGGRLGIQAGAYVLLTVTDRGMGMDAPTQERVFEPFFTTKEPGKGTGIGLSTVRAIVKPCGGHVVLESEIGRGTSVRVYLPRA
jgi:two-component system cell cycle sensor histidine kinase/response regulator CckA